MLTLNDGRKELYQWDTGRTATVDIECDVVHFANLKYGESLAVEVKGGEVSVPNKLLTSGASIYCWAFVIDESGAYTKMEQAFDVIKRAKPSDYVYTETEVITIQTAVENALEEAKDSGEFKPVKGVDYFTDEDIAELNIPAVDQTYSPDSENAQSGKAVAEAVTTEEKRADNTFANALKGTASGSTILIDDVSPVAHEIFVVLDVGGATVAKYGKNLAPSTFNYNDVPGLSITDNGDGSISIKGTVAQNSFSPLIKNFVLPRGTYCVSGIFPSDWELKYGYALIDGKSISASKTVITLSERKTVTLSIVFVEGVQYDLVIRPQIEVGTTSTEWEKYKEPIIYTADESGNVSGIVGNGNDITLTTNDDVKISVKYNKDINKMFTKLTQAIISLGGNV